MLTLRFPAILCQMPIEYLILYNAGVAGALQKGCWDKVNPTIFLERNLIGKVILPYSSAFCHVVLWIRHQEPQASFGSLWNLRAHALRFNSATFWDMKDVSKRDLSQLSTTVQF